MKKSIHWILGLIGCIILQGAAAFAQNVRSPDWERTDLYRVYDMADDKTGNVYVAGQVLNGPVVTLKYDTDGNLLWWQEENHDGVAAIRVGLDNNIYIASSRGVSGLGYDAVVVKRSPDGAFVRQSSYAAPEGWGHNTHFTALTVDAAIPDGQPVLAVLSEIKRQNGVPALSWAPGKWFGKRGAVVRDLIDSLAPQDFILGDTTLRPTVWPEPALMRRGSEKGFRIVAGSDPLPFAGEEDWVGSYASLWTGSMDVENPAAALKEILWNGKADRIGRRGGAIPTVLRLFRNACSKRNLDR